ncbi:hypothetical protein KAU15_05125, partial [candidate division WOR-3 bacterium]|nr:hypothetical protein [candidate division WOR-3 bacterium]
MHSSNYSESTYSSNYSEYILRLFGICNFDTIIFVNVFLVGADLCVCPNDGRTHRFAPTFIWLCEVTCHRHVRKKDKKERKEIKILHNIFLKLFG